MFNFSNKRLGSGRLKLGVFLTINSRIVATVGGILAVAALVIIAASFRDASNLNAGTISAARLPFNVARYDAKAPIFNHSLTAAGFRGGLIGNVKGNVVGNLTGNVTGNADTASALAAKPTGCTSGTLAEDITINGDLICSVSGSGLTGLNASNISIGTLADNRLSRNIAKYNDPFPAFTGNLTAASFTGNLSGNATTATALLTAPAINGVNFDGTADIIVVANAGTLTGTTLNSTVTASSLTSVGTLTSLTVASSVAANSFTGNLSGNATTATALQTAWTINGVSFNGTSNITVPANAGTLTGTTLNSTVTASSLTSVGTLTSLSVATGAVNFSTASSLTVPITSSRINGGNTCSPIGTIIFSTNTNSTGFFGCTGTWLAL
jgi:hypothetical protein